MESLPPRSISVIAFALALVINPGYFVGCVGDTADEFQFGEAEMLELVDRVNDQEAFVFESAGEVYRLELTLEQAQGEDDGTAAAGTSLAARRALACGSRTFMNSAAACISSSEVALLADLRLYRTTRTRRAGAGTAAVGSLSAWGKQLGASQSCCGGLHAHAARQPR